MIPPSDRVPKKDCRLDRGGIEACSGVKSISWTLLRVSDFSGIYSAGIRSNGAGWAPQGTRARPGASWPTAPSSGPLPKLPVLVMSRKKSPKSFVAFGLRLVLIFWKTKNRQKNINWHWALS